MVKRSARTQRFGSHRRRRGQEYDSHHQPPRYQAGHLLPHTMNGRLEAVSDAARMATTKSVAPRPRRPNGSTPSRWPSVDHRRAPVYTSTLTGSRGKADRVAFVDGCVTNFFAVGDKADLVSEAQRVYNRDIAAFASPKATLDCIGAFGRTDFRADLAAFTVPTLIIHGDSDAIVPFEASGKRSHEAIAGSQLVLVDAAPAGLNVTHADIFNWAPVDFLAT